MVHRPEARVPPEADVRELWLREPTPRRPVVRALALAASRGATSSWRSTARSRSSAACAGSRCDAAPWRAPSSGCCGTRTPPDSGRASSPPPCSRCSRCMPSASRPTIPPSSAACRASTISWRSAATSCVYQPCMTPTLGHRATRCGPCSTPVSSRTHPALDARRRVARRSGRSVRPGDWAVHNPGARSGRLGGRAGERLLSAASTSRRSRSPCCRTCRSQGTHAGTARARARPRVDARHAGTRRRLGGVRHRQRRRRFLDAVPFPDLEGVTDPPSADTTGRVLAAAAEHAASGSAWAACAEAPSSFAARSTRMAAGRDAGASTRSTARGSRVTGLAAAGEDPRAAHVQRAVAWLAARQNADGGWGESVALLRGRRAARVRRQHPVADGMGADGSPRRRRPRPPGRGARSRAPGAHARTPTAAGRRSAFTATAVPRRAYLRYELFPLHYPLRALGQYRARVASTA